MFILFFWFCDNNDNKMEQNKRVQRVQLMSSEGEVITIDREVANRFERLKELLGANDFLYFPNTRSIILRKLLTWSFYHKYDPGPRNDDDSTSWYTEFFDVDQGTLLELIETACFLDLPKLLNKAQGL